MQTDLKLEIHTDGNGIQGLHEYSQIVNTGFMSTTTINNRIYFEMICRINLENRKTNLCMNSKIQE